MMNYARLLLLSCALLCGTTVAAQDLPIPNNTPIRSLNSIAAVVNHEIITQQQLDHAVIAAKQQLQQNNIATPAPAQLRAEVLQQLIYQHLQLEIAHKNKITASDKEVDAAITRIAAQNRLSLAQLQEKLVQQGLPYKVFRHQIRKQLIITQLQHEAIASSVHVNKAEILAFRRQHQEQANPAQYRIENILIPLADGATPTQTQQAKQQAAKVLQQLRAGKSFASLADAHAGSSDLGWRALNDLPALFAKQVVTMNVGSFSPVLPAANGFHIIKLDGKRRQAGLSDQQIQSLLMRQKFTIALQKWLKKLRQSAYIHINQD